MTIRAAERHGHFVINVAVFSIVPALFFLLHEIFALSISYFYTVISSVILNQLIIYTYRARDICFIIAFLFVIFKRQLTLDSFIVAISLFLVYIMTNLLYPENNEYLEIVRPYLMLGVESYIIIRSKLANWNILKKSSIWVARILVVLVAIGLINVSHQPQYLSHNYMTFSNAMLVPAAITIFSYYESKGILKIADIVLSTIGLLMILVYGSRGAFVLLVAYAILIVFMKTEKRKVLTFGTLGLVLLVLLMSSLSNDNVLLSFLGGQQSRTIEKILSGELLTSNRNNIYVYLIGKAFDDGLLGHGICADRYYLPLQFIGGDANYAHNFYVEMLVDFGLIGVIFSAVVTWIIIKRCIKIKKSIYKAYLLAFFFIAFLQLLVSRSWLTEANFFIFMGFLMTYKNGSEDGYEESISTNTDLSQ